MYLSIDTILFIDMKLIIDSLQRSVLMILLKFKLLIFYCEHDFYTSVNIC